MVDPSDQQLEKHSVSIAGHRTSISLEPPFWRHLRQIAAKDGLSLNELVRQVDETRAGNLSSALRVLVITRMEAEVCAGEQTDRQENR